LQASQTQAIHPDAPCGSQPQQLSVLLVLCNETVRQIPDQVVLQTCRSQRWSPTILRKSMKKDVADFISTLFHSSTVTHFMHLSTDSYATHKALGKYYPAIVELADTYAEAYSGCYEKIKDFPENFHNAKDPQKYLASIKTYIEKNRDALPDDTQLQNIVDEIAALVDSTIYLLSFK